MILLVFFILTKLGSVLSVVACGVGGAWNSRDPQVQFRLSTSSRYCISPQCS